MQIAYWTWKWENEKIPSWWFQCLSEMRVKVKSRDESLGRGNKKFVDKVIHTVRKQCTRQIQLSYRSSSSAPLEFYMIYLKRNQSAWLHFFLAATFIFLYISTELMVGWLNHHRLGFYQEKKNDRREKKVKEIARNNNSDKPWALSFKRKEVIVRKCWGRLIGENWLIRIFAVRLFETWAVRKGAGRRFRINWIFQRWRSFYKQVSGWTVGVEGWKERVERMIGEILVKELRGQHVGTCTKDVNVTGKDGMSWDKGKGNYQRVRMRAQKVCRWQQWRREVNGCTSWCLCASKTPIWNTSRRSCALWFLVQPLESLSGCWRQGDVSTYSPGGIRLAG